MGTVDSSLYASDQVIERQVTLPNGAKHTLYFKEVPGTEFRRYYEAENSDKEEVRVGAQARLIAASLCEPDGTAAMTYKQALKLKAQASKAIFLEIVELNGLNTGPKKEPSPSEETSGSGTPSPSPSEAGP